MIAYVFRTARVNVIQMTDYLALPRGFEPLLPA
jgi:hypothetical protein